jgi:hypothetical protein
MPKNRITKVTRTVTRTPKANKDPFYGIETVCTTVTPDIVNSIEEVLLKSGLNRSEFVRNAVIRELAYHQFCNFHKVDPTTYPVFEGRITPMEVDAAVAKAKHQVLDEVSKALGIK